MTQIDVTLTDFLLAAECLVFAVLLTRRSAANVPARYALIIVFYSLAAAAAIGAVVHGFFYAGGPVEGLLWLLTMAALGCVGCSAWILFAYGTFAPRAAQFIAIAAAVGLAIYIAVILFVSQDFAIAIADYLPANLAPAVMFLMRALRSRITAAWQGLIGVLLTFLAAGIQQSGIDLHPRYLNHNALYHLIQAVGLFLMYRGGAFIASQPSPSREPSGATVTQRSA